MELLTIVVLALVAVLFGGLGGALGAHAVLRASGPVATAEMLAELLNVRQEWGTWRKGAEAMLEQLDELEEVIERKRRRVAARESKANGTQPAGVADLRARARARGDPV